jgi:hypothetical protein
MTDRTGNDLGEKLLNMSRSTMRRIWREVDAGRPWGEIMASLPRPDSTLRAGSLESARRALASLNARSPRYLKSAGRLAYKWRMSRGLTEAEAHELRADALAARWRAANGLEYRFLVALMLASQPEPDALAELRPADFASVPYAALFAAWREQGVPVPTDAAELLEGRGYVPASPPRASTAAHLPPSWWADELRSTVAELLARRQRWAEHKAARVSGTGL